MKNGKNNLKDLFFEKCSKEVNDNHTAADKTVTDQKQDVPSLRKKLDAFERERSRQRYNSIQSKKRHLLEQLLTLAKEEEEQKKIQQIEQAKTAIEQIQLVQDNDEHITLDIPEPEPEPMVSDSRNQILDGKSNDFTESTQSALYRLYMYLYNSSNEHHVIDVKIGNRTSNNKNTFINSLSYSIDHEKAIIDAEKKSKNDVDRSK